MMRGRALPLAAGLLLVGLASGYAQMPPGGGAPMGQQLPPCYNDFMPLRQDAEKKAAAVRALHEKKGSPQQACELIGAFSEAEAKVLKFVEKNGSWCGIPDPVVNQMKANHAHTVELHKQICTAAANPPKPAGPSLSDALDPSGLTTDKVGKRGNGTFDTLTGNALGK
jgi:hypothetical protein